MSSSERATGLRGSGHHRDRPGAACRDVVADYDRNFVVTMWFLDNDDIVYSVLFALAFLAIILSH